MQHVVTVREAETFQSLTLQSTLYIPTRKHHMRQLEGTKTGLGVILELQGKQNSNNCEKDKGLLFLLFWLHQLSVPAHRSFLIFSQLFFNPLLSISKRQNVKCIY